MKLLFQLFFLFGMCLLGEGISILLPVTIPASIISMVLLLCSLLLHFIKTDTIKDVSEFLLQNMSFFFIPAGVGILEKYSILRGNILILLFISLITLILTFIATSYTVLFVISLQEKRKKE